MPYTTQQYSSLIYFEIRVAKNRGKSAMKRFPYTYNTRKATKQFQKRSLNLNTQLRSYPFCKQSHCNKILNFAFTVLVNSPVATTTVAAATCRR